jgi:hypothetical protein
MGIDRLTINAMSMSETDSSQAHMLSKLLYVQLT